MFEARQNVSIDHAVPSEDSAQVDSPIPASAPPAAAVTAPTYAGFQLPRRVWVGMLASYAVFFVAIAVATAGSGHAIFAIVVSILYTVMFFGLARVMARQAGREAASPLARQQPLQTWSGPMEPGAVYGQILVVPAAIAVFAVAIAVVKVAVF